MRDNFLLIELVECMLGATLGFPAAAILGYDPRLGFVLGLVIVIVPSMLLGHLASDFACDGTLSPNLAARLLNPLEYIRAMAAGIGFLAMLSLPIGMLLGFRGRSLAIFGLASGVLLCGVLSGLLAIIMRPKKQNAK
jgi:hypothetical protein